MPRKRARTPHSDAGDGAVAVAGDGSRRAASPAPKRRCVARQPKTPNCLARNGSFIVNVLGDGNCLFRSLAEQLVGDPDRHADIRRAIVVALQCNYRQYLPYTERWMLHSDAPPQWHSSRGASATAAQRIRRTTRGTGRGRGQGQQTCQSPSDRAPGLDTPMTTAEQTEAMRCHLRRMARDRTWGDSLEIAGFVRAFRRRVVVYKEEGYVLVFEVDEDEERKEQARTPVPPLDCRDNDDDSDSSDGHVGASIRPLINPDDPSLPKTIHIMWHDWGHYSSVRRHDGPPEGTPNCLDDLFFLKNFAVSEERIRKMMGIACTPPPSPSPSSRSAQPNSKSALEFPSDNAAELNRATTNSTPNGDTSPLERLQGMFPNYTTEALEGLLASVDGDIDHAVQLVLGAQSESPCSTLSPDQGTPARAVVAVTASTSGGSVANCKIASTPANRKYQATVEDCSDSESSPSAVRRYQATVEDCSDSESSRSAVRRYQATAEDCSDSESSRSAVRRYQATVEDCSDSESSRSAVRRYQATVDDDSDSESSPSVVRRYQATVEDCSDSESSRSAVRRYQATVDDDSDSESSLSVVTSNSSVDVSAEVAEELHELSQQQIEPAPAPKLKPKPRPNCSRNGNSAATTSSTSKPTKQVPVNGDSISAVKSVKPHRPGTPPYADILGRAVSPFHDEDEYATEVPHPARLIDLEPCTGDVERADTSHVRTGSLANTKPPNTTANVYITTWIPRPDPAVEPDLGPVEVECNEAGHLLSEHDEAMRTPTPDPERWTIPEPQRPPTPHPIFTTMVLRRVLAYTHEP